MHHTRRYTAILLIAMAIISLAVGCSGKHVTQGVRVEEPAAKNVDVQEKPSEAIPQEAAAAEESKSAPVVEQAGSGESRAVYITRTGECYHAAGCASLRRSKIAIKLKDAEARGYRACLRCGGG